MPDTQRGFNINVFRAEFLSRDVMRSNLFVAEFSIPPGMTDGDGIQTYINTVRRLEYWIEATTLPGVTIRSYQAQRYGYGNMESRPLMNTFSEVTFDVIFDRNHLNYDFFSDWMNLIVNRDSSQGPLGNTGPFKSRPNELEYRENYAADVSIYIFDQSGNVVKQLILREAFPTVLGDIRLAWSDNNTFMRLPISMIYNDWYEIDTQNAPVPAGQNPGS